MIDATTEAALEQELSRKTKVGLTYLCGKYGITGYEGKVKAELKTLMLEHSALLLGKAKQTEAEHATPVSIEDIRTEIKDLLFVPWWSRLFNRTAAWASIIGLVMALLAVDWYVDPFGADPQAPVPAAPFGKDSEEPFDSDQGTYSILILPFAPLQDCTTVDTQMEEAIRRRLLDISEQDGLGLQVKVYKSGGCPRTFTEGRELGARFKADLVVWGDYYVVCSTELEACVKYALVKQVEGVERQGKSATESFKLSQIQEGKLQGDIDFIIQWTLGLREYKRSNWKNALAHFQSIKKDTDDLSFCIGSCFTRLGDLEKAISHYSNVIKLNPEYAAAFYNRGCLYHYLKKYEQAITDFGQAIRIDPQFALAFNNRGFSYKALKKYDLAIADFGQAIADFGQAIAPKPLLAVVYGNRGLCYYTLEKYNLAIADYGQAIMLNPQDARAYNNRGLIYWALEKYDQAIVDCGQAIRLDPQDASAYINRGGLYRKLEKYDQAIADFDQAIILNPQLAAAFNARGGLYRELEKYDQAIADYERAITLNPQYADAFNNRGWTYSTLKKYEQAIADYGQAIRLNPHSAVAFNNRGGLYYKLQKYDQAIADYGQAIVINPHHAEAFYNRGNTYSALKKYEQAIADYGQAIRLNPHYAEAFYNRGNTFRLLKMYDQAIADFGSYIRFADSEYKPHVPTAEQWIKELRLKKANAETQGDSPTLSP